MRRTLKADFHLHTHHSDNRDRMTPADYVGLARGFGYDVLGFCDHHHNLTQASWAQLRAEVAEESAKLGASELLLTTGYEATWMTGHLCILGKDALDGESIAACERQMWSPSNTRILAHPDNNICAWHLPLPVGVQGVEVINGGQDPYSVYVGSPCNGLTTYQRYLLLNHKVGAIAQSDCHERAIFGRAWTGIQVDDDAPLRWEVVQSALNQAHTFAAMGDLPVRLWTEDGCGPGDTLHEPTVDSLWWEVPSGAEVTVYVANRPVAHFAATANEGEKCSGRYSLHHNGPHWLLVKRGLAWAVSSPIWVSNQLAATAAPRMRLAQNGAVQAQVERLRRQLDWLAALDPLPEQTPYPVIRYVEWLQAQLPTAWSEVDPAFSGLGDEADWAMARLHATQQIITPILRDLCRTRHRPSPPSAEGVHLLVAALPAQGDAQRPLLSSGLYRTIVDLPRNWVSPQVTNAEGVEIPTLSLPIPGERDPLQGQRSRVQMNELVTWLARGEIHEYQIHLQQLGLEGDEYWLIADLWPAALGRPTKSNPDAAQALITAIADPKIMRFFVHLRMPRRFALIFELDETIYAETLLLNLLPVSGQESGKENEQTTRFYQDELLAHDPSLATLVVQLT
jgi:hypothetical protein